MRFTENKSLIISIYFVLITAIAPGFYGKSKNDEVRPGMSIDDALTVAVNCIHAASGIKKTEIRPNDTLDFLGITTELRLDALRRYIVRNTEIGVQNIWVFRQNRRLSQHFIISNSAFEKIDKSWTVEKLARTISDRAGLPNLDYKKSAQIVADSRDCVLKGITAPTAEGRCQSNAGKTSARTQKKDKKPKTSSSTKIWDDFKREEGKVRNFIDLLQTDKVVGIPSAGISDSAGDDFFYFLSKTITDEKILLKGVKECEWSYDDLISFIYDYAEIPLTPELTASQLVLSAIAEVIDQQTANVRNSKRTFVFNLPDLLARQVKNRNIAIKEEHTLKDLNIAPSKISMKLEELLSPEEFTICETNKFQQFLQVTSKNRQVRAIRMANTAPLSKITDQTTVGELIDIVTESLK